MAISTKLAILGTLSQGKMHGYELHQKIGERMGEYTNVRLGSIYHALNSFAEKGQVEIVSVEHQLGSPDRHIYQITEKGRKLLLRLLNAELERDHQHMDPIGIALNFLYLLPAKKIKEKLRGRLRAIRDEESRVLNQRTETLKDPNVPRFVGLIFDHGIKHLKAEIEWLEESIHRLDTEPDILVMKK